MLAKRLPLFWAFAGGCLGGAALIGFWRTGADTTIPNDTVVAHTKAPQHEQAPPQAVDPDPTTIPVAASPKDTDDTDSAPPTEPGSSVADVLIRLEVAYRQRLAAADPADPAPAQTTITVSQHEVPAREETTVAAAAPKSDPELDAQPAGAPPAENEPVLASRDDARPRDVFVGDVHIGDVNQNIHVGDVNQVDVHPVQQVAVLQYIQFLTLSPQPPIASPTIGHRGTTRRPPPSLTSLINPDNPWGFDFPPSVLVK